MADKNIDQLAAIGTVLAADLVEVETGGVNKKATVTELTLIEATARAAADSTLTTNLGLEETNRTNADSALQTDINNRIKKDGTVVFTADQSHGGFKATNLGTPTAGGDATNKTYVDLKLALVGGTMSGAIAMGTNKITGLGDPTLAQDAMTLLYAETNFWSLAGNAPGNDTSFIGTTDNQDFLIVTNNTNRIKFTKAGLVGIGAGSLTPSWALDVSAANMTTANGATLKLRNIGSGINYTETAILFNSSLNGNTDYMTGRIFAIWDGTGAGVDSRLSAQVENGAGGFNTVWSIKGSKMGIGITTPTEMLHLVGNHKTTGQSYQDKYTLSDSATIALNWNNSNVQYVVLAGNRTFTFANPKDGAIYTLIIKQDAVGTRLLTWPIAILWGGGTAPTLTATVNKTDVIQLVYDATNAAYYDISIKLNH